MRKEDTERGIRLRADVSNLLFQFGKIFLDHGPDLVQVEAEVLMHQDVSQRDDLRPRNIRKALSEGLGQTAVSLSDHLKLVDHPDL